MKSKKTVVVICSARAEHLQISLPCAHNQTVPFSAIVLVAWGANANNVAQIASGTPRVQVVHGPESGTTPIQRNLGLKQARLLKPDNIVFIDDDTFLGETWHEHVLRVAEYATGCSIGSVVTFASNPRRVQSGGHVFSAFRPLDIAYGTNVENDITSRKQVAGIHPEMFSCPCANCALIPWRALQRINEVDGNYWDERFPRLICFELGFKMHRLGYGYVVAPGASAAHDGYLHRQNLQKKDVQEQLLSRILLYKKFLPEPERSLALTDLEKRVVRWASHKYPHSRLAGQDIVQTYNAVLFDSLQHEFGLEWTRKIE